MGVLTRYDLLVVGRLPSEDRVPLPAQDDPALVFRYGSSLSIRRSGVPAGDHALDVAVSRVLGVRVDYQHGTDIDYLAALHETAGYTNGGTGSADPAAAQGKPDLYRDPECSRSTRALGKGFTVPIYAG